MSGNTRITGDISLTIWRSAAVRDRPRSRQSYQKTGFRQQRREADPVFHHSGGESFAVLPGKHLLLPSGIHRRGILGIVEESGSSRWSVISKKTLPGILCSPAGEDQQYRSVHRFNRQPDRDRTVYECGRRIGEAGIGNEEKKWRIGKSGKNSF